ncbi:leucine-rich repeat-containing protein 57 [Neocloeon triangulifer]|uniref:leucine-rich repeat-containing protein 57 n=1 Tax=Neocloeon triangulifer TaxID=2078957 RepID=UPI00286F9E17|nr:leucine-rich repeat-containing protein 57 [Neocloeon triangulifer]
MNGELVKDLQAKIILHWNARNFTTLPNELQHYGSHAKEIYLRWNNIHVLPSWIGFNLTSLTNLYLEFNKLNSIPNELSFLKNLETLHLDSNNFTTIPEPIFKLSALKCLKFSRNLIKSIPKDIKMLNHLECLDISGNLLKFLPFEISFCVNLREINLGENQLLWLPRSMTRLPKLEIISVETNSLHFLPALPFRSLPIIDIRLNSKLNWCSIQALGQKFVNLDHCGEGVSLEKRCGDWTIVSQQFIETRCSGCTQTIFLPSDLRISHQNESTVSSLVELSQRVVYEKFYAICQNEDLGCKDEEEAMDVDEDLKHFKLPKEIEKRLEQGPSAICFKCQRPLFTHVYLSVTHSNVIQIPHCLVFYCSKSCASE